MLYAHILFAAKAAAHRHGAHPHRFAREPQHIGAFMLRLVHALIAAKDAHAVALGACHGALGLQKRMLGKRHAVTVGDHMRAGLDGGVNIAAPHLLMAQQVLAPLVHPRCAIGHGSGGGEHGHKRFVGNAHKLLACVERFLRFRNDQRNRVA